MDESKFSDPRQESHVNGLALKGPVKHLTIDDLKARIEALEAKLAEHLDFHRAVDKTADAVGEQSAS